MDTKFPLNKLLKGKLLKIAELQDKLIVELLSKFDVVLHGGTAIWRVYGGKRFSYDLDLYFSKPKEILEHFKKSDFTMLKGKVTGSDVVYMKFSDGVAEVEVEVSPMFRKVSPVDGEFFMVGGDSLIIGTLSARDLIQEKIDAFKGRKKARDLYDIFFLLDKADIHLKGLKPIKVPRDFAGLKEIILMGKCPDFETIKRKVYMYAKG
ncbi:MAG: nucleotidyl transferase AbiEii/AbiGii toxin family protein [Candidatus Aenigmarchaeota archaeon]|nr:nucleotidyl transferase AbiEii/AbiGii toxin family protein [Candidatus Aenigmarchaeota archaeon]